MARLSVFELCEYQKKRELPNSHLVSLDETGFTIAHTEHEREMEMDLTKCGLHTWLDSQDGPPEEPGIYAARSGYDGWHLTELKDD